MSTTKFTPGPWLLRDRTVYAGSLEICTADAFDVDNDEADANAHLIAAAPLLYVALERLVDAVDPESTGWSEAVDTLAAARGERHE